MTVGVRHSGAILTIDYERQITWQDDKIGVGRSGADFVPVWGWPASRIWRRLYTILLEMLAAFGPWTQWMVFLCAVIYFAAFILLQHRQTSWRFWRASNRIVANRRVADRRDHLCFQILTASKSARR